MVVDCESRGAVLSWGELLEAEGVPVMLLVEVLDDVGDVVNVLVAEVRAVYREVAEGWVAGETGGERLRVSGEATSARRGRLGRWGSSVGRLKVPGTGGPG